MRRTSTLRQLLPANAERGAAAIILALTIVVLIGIAAWVIDGSALFQERRELQNGADAAALAIAADCAFGACGDVAATAEFYVDANATDFDSDVPVGGVTFPTANSVTVRVVTADGGTDLDGDPSTVDFVFAPVLGIKGSAVVAEATAAWESVGGGTTLPIVFSLCEFEDATGYDPVTQDGAVFYDPGSPPFYSDVASHVIFFHLGFNNGINVPEECAAEAGQDLDGDGSLPGGFGWLEQEECTASFVEDEWVAAKPGNGPPSACNPEDLLNEILLMPVFNDVSQSVAECTVGPGGKCYLIAGFAAFYVTGFRFPGGPEWVQNPPCNPPKTCIGGHFLEFILIGALGDGDSNFGAQTIWLVS